MLKFSVSEPKVFSQRLCLAGFRATERLPRPANASSPAPSLIGCFRFMAVEECRQLLKNPSAVNLNLLHEGQKGSLRGEIKPIVPRKPLTLKTLAVVTELFPAGISFPKLHRVSFASFTLKWSPPGLILRLCSGWFEGW